MRKLVSIIVLFYFNYGFSQYIQVDSQAYTAQQLIENILIDSNCIENIVVTNAVGGNFNNINQSYGYFDASNTSFPFERGIVLSTGMLSNTQGPNATLSDDDAPNWLGDSDLETVLEEQNTLNATILEFDFTAIADRISFRYIFASEEYEENNPNTCQFSDLFGFLIRAVNQQEYTNIALVPNTSTPIKVTTVHPDIPNGCPAINETYFGSFNGTEAPINFNGQTVVLNAVANLVPNETYHVKLVIADEQNYRYDSAVFLEAGSFELNTNLGPDRLLSTNNPMCENGILTLDATQPGNNTYKWFKNSIELLTETIPSLTVIDAGVYNVEVTLPNNCISYGEVTIEYATNPLVSNTSIIECDPDADGLSIYNLTETHITSGITNNDNTLNVSDYFMSFNDAVQNLNPINGALSFSNTIPNQILYARVENQYGCHSISEIMLQTSNSTIIVNPFEICDDISNNGLATFNLGIILDELKLFVPLNSQITLYNSIDAIFNSNLPLNNSYQNSIPYSESIYAEVILNNDCFAIIEVPLLVYDIPEMLPDENVYYCLNKYPTPITLYNGGINAPLNGSYTYVWNTGETTPTIGVNNVETYTVTITNQNSCTSSRSITVLPSNVASIDDIIIEESGNNNTITIEISGEGDFEYALDFINGPYQDDNIFTDVKPGFHTIYVRNKNNCGISEQLVSVLGFPKFLTPNGDGINDTWQLYGVNSQFNQGAIVSVFDRYGNLLKTFDNNSIGWNGTLNGNPLPSSDYWFVAKLSNGKEYYGHFALVR